MKRYNLEEKQAYQGLSMWLAKDGEFCCYDDVEQLESENKKLRDALEKILTVDRSKGGIMQIIAKQALEATK